jgi:hypothetical protein
MRAEFDDALDDVLQQVWCAARRKRWGAIELTIEFEDGYVVDTTLREFSAGMDRLMRANGSRRRARRRRG